MIFVFGSNLAGRHGAGAALTAVKYHGAVHGEGQGLRGNSYAIPTKGFAMEVLSLEEILGHVGDFITHAETNFGFAYQVTRIGCGLAGYQDEQIAPMFRSVPRENCFFDSKWRPFLGNGFEYWGTF